MCARASPLVLELGGAGEREGDGDLVCRVHGSKDISIGHSGLSNSVGGDELVGALDAAAV